MLLFRRHCSFYVRFARFRGPYSPRFIQSHEFSLFVPYLFFFALFFFYCTKKCARVNRPKPPRFGSLRGRRRKSEMFRAFSCCSPIVQTRAAAMCPSSSSSSCIQKIPFSSRTTGGHVTTEEALCGKRRTRRLFANARARNEKQKRDRRGALIVRNGDLGGNYGDSFGDVDNLLVNYFTFKALKSSLAQMQETDLSPGKGEYKWLYNFASENYKNDGQKFIRALFAEGRRDHAERLIKQREDLLQRWIKRFAETGGLDCGVKMNRENLSLLREHMMNSVSFAEEGEGGIDLDGRSVDDSRDEEDEECEECDLQS